MVKDTNAGDVVSIKTPIGKQRETISLPFPLRWLDRTWKPRICLTAEH